MMSMRKTLACALIAVVSCFAVIEAGFASDHLPSSAGTYSAGFIGNYAGHLSGGEAVSELQLAHPEVGDETHDFSEDAASEDDATAHYSSESLGSLGDHLDEHSFPTDYSNDEHSHHDSTAEYAEAASEHHEEYEPYGGAVSEDHQHHQSVDFDSDHESLNAIDLGGGWHGGDYFDSKPVVGIDHGKGAFSYSTLYEREDEKSH